MHRSGITSVYGPDAPPGPNMINNVSEMVAPNVSHIYIHVVLLTRAAALHHLYRSQRILSHGMHRSGITSVYGPDAPPGPNMINNVSEMVAPNVSHIYIHVVLLTRAAALHHSCTVHR